MHVLVVGAGPAGMLLALLLAKQGIEVEVIEKATDLDKQPRATHYAAPAVYELARAGVLPEMYAGGFVPNGVCWRKLDGTKLTGLSSKGVIPDDYPYKMVCYPLDRLGTLLKQHLERLPNVKIHWAHKLVKINQDETSASAEVSTPDGSITMTADYVVGCDGARSGVRRQLFGDDFPGFTWNEQIVATNTYYDFDQFGWDDSNFVVHPEHYFMAARISPHRGKEALWRVTYGELSGLNRDELIARQPEKFRTFLPGHPEPSEYNIVNFSPYQIHQRCAHKLRVGRVLLAADAAHLCNPFGGLGLTGGIADVGGLADCLVGIHQGVAADDILDHYDRVRRQIYDSVINPVSSENFSRLNSQDPEKALETDSFFQLCLKGEQDAEFSRQLQLSVKDMLQHDFTQYFDTKSTGVAMVSV